MGAVVLDWRIDSIDSIGGHPVEVLGGPRVTGGPDGAAVVFDGDADALVIPASPLAGLTRYTVEVVVRPDAGGGFEQRFFHAGSVHGDRFLFELRAPDEKSWYLDVYVSSADQGRTLIDPGRTHPLGRWHTVAATVDGSRVVSFVDGRRELEGALISGPAPAGRTSLGARQNLTSWFRGAIARVRVSDDVLPASELLRP